MKHRRKWFFLWKFLTQSFKRVVFYHTIYLKICCLDTLAQVLAVSLYTRTLTSCTATIFPGCDHILLWCCVLASFTNLYSQVPLHSVMWQIGNKYIQHLICSHFCFVRTQPISWKGTCIIYEFGERWYLDFEGATNFFQSEFGGYQIKRCWSIISTIVVRSSTW